MEFRSAKKEELGAVLALYDSVRGRGFCVWDESYPTAWEAEGDLAAGGLFVLTEKESILGVLSVLPENEMDHLPHWRITEGAREIGRIAVHPSAQGRGLAGVMVGEALTLLARQGISAVHISAATVNIPAQKTYAKLGFETVGEVPLYGGKYFLLEKLL